MANGNGSDDTSRDPDEFSSGVHKWLVIEEDVRNTLREVDKLGADGADVALFVMNLHRSVRLWLSYELWSDVFEEGSFTPDGLLERIISGELPNVIHLGGRDSSPYALDERGATTEDDDDV